MFQRSPTATAPAWALTIGVVALLAAALAALALLGGRSLPDRAGPPIEELAVERTVLTPGVIDLTVRNTGPDPVQVAQVFVNDAYVDVTAPPSRSGDWAPTPCACSTPGRTASPTSSRCSPRPGW